MSGIEIDSKNDPMMQSEFTVIESDEVVNQSSSSSSDDSVETDELPDLVEIDHKEKPTEKEANVEVVEDPEEEKVSAWDDLLGTGRLHIRKITPGDIESSECKRGSLIKVEILTPEASFSTDFGTEQCALKTHSIMELTMADHVDPAPGAVELSLHGMGVGGEVAVRAHKDLCAHLPGEFQIKVLEVEKDELKQAQDSKEKGNALFKEGNFEKASKYYERGISYLNEYHADQENTDESKEVWTKLSKNLGRCYFKTGQNEKSLETLNAILIVDKMKNLDVLLLKVEVLMKTQNDYDELLRTCQAVLALSPSTQIESKMKSRIEKIKEIKKAKDEKYKKMCQKMTGTYETKVEPVNQVPVASSSNQKTPDLVTSKDQSESPIPTALIIGAVFAAGIAAIYILSKK